MAITAIYSDVDIELTQATDGDITRDTDEEAVINSIRNIINTLQGSRRMLPEFAASIQRMLFEPIDESTANHLKRKLIENVNRWDNRVAVEGIYVNPDYEKNAYNCLLKFQIIGFEHKGFRTIDFVLRRA
jgi:phage baseplate assembly protein W